MCRSRQSGAVLAVSLIMLGLLTLIGVTAINTGLVNFKLVGNLQAEKAVEMALHKAGQEYLSSDAPFSGFTTCDPPATTMVVNGLSITVDIDEPLCINVAEPEGESLSGGMATNVSMWEIRATAVDPASGARAVARWGIAMPLLTICPPVRTGNGC